MAQAAVEAAHREEDALLRAGRELAPGPRLQLLAQAEALGRRGREGRALRRSLPRPGWRGVGGGVYGRTTLTCGAGVATRHVEAVVRMRGVGVRIPRDGDAPAGRLVRLPEMEAALEGALVVLGGEGEEGGKRERERSRA